MPVRDAEATLPACVASIQRQRGARWECVVVDDGSSDGSVAYLAALAASDARFRVFRQAPSGIVAALTRGLSECRGGYVARMDGDDIMLARRLARQVDALEADPTLAGVGCHVRVFPRARPSVETGLGRREYEDWLNSLRSAEDVARDAFVECPLAHPTFMLRRSVLEAHRYRDAGWPEDYDLVLRLLGAGLRLGVVPERLLCWRDGASRLSRTSAIYALEQFVLCKAHFLAQGLLRASAGYILWGYGKTGQKLARALEAHGKQPRAIIELHPGRLGQRILQAKVSSPEALPGLLRQLRVPVVVSVARRGPRGEVRAALAAFGCVEGRDYVCAA